MSARHEVTDSEEPAEIAALRKHAEKEGVGFLDGQGSTGDSFAIEYRNGRDVRKIFVDEDDAPQLLSLPLGSYTFLAQYEAILDSASGVIEAVLRSPVRGSVGMTQMRRLLRLPNATARAGFAKIDSRDINSWEVRLDHPANSTWISAMSPEFSSILDGAIDLDRITVKIECGGGVTHDAAVKILETVVHSVLFNLDLTWGIVLDIARRLPGRVLLRRARTGTPLLFPKFQYPPEPLELYRYGRAAQDLPLLQFLAFYQAVEYFFPVYTNEVSLRRIRNLVRDPRFDPSNDSSIAQILQAAKDANGSATEREQLRAVLRTATSNDSLASYFRGVDDLTHFTAKQKMRGLNSLKLEGDLAHAVADRLYAIRCRIVHAKQGGGDTGVDLLLPSSKEAAAIGPDVALMRHVAQQVLVDQASPIAL